jgi:hypothetical protein
VWSFGAVPVLVQIAVAFSGLSGQAQDLNVYTNGRGSDMSNRNAASMGVPSFQDTIEDLTQRAKEDERERVTEENRLRRFRNPDNIEEHRTEYYFGQISPSQRFGNTDGENNQT